MENLKKKSKPNPLFDHPLNKLMRGDVVWDDAFVDDMAEGKKPAEPIKWDKILKPIDQCVVDKDEVVRTYSDAIERAMCPKYHDGRKPFQLFDDATWYSDGEDVKCYNIRCLGTESSPCSKCPPNKDKVTRFAAGVYTPSPSPAKPPKKNGLVEANGFNKEDFEGEEETPRKVSADACKWCFWDPCVLEDDESNEEARVLVDNLMTQEEQGIELQFRNYRHALCRLYARRLGYKHKRFILPVCVQGFVDKHFSVKDEKRTGFKEE